MSTSFLLHPHLFPLLCGVDVADQSPRNSSVLLLLDKQSVHLCFGLPFPLFQVSRIEFEQIDLAITSLLANHPVASESEHARDQCQSSAVTPPVNLSFSSPSRHFNSDRDECAGVTVC